MCKPWQGEHGTGRNVAPYVEMEWGSRAYNLMWRLKELFDPDYVLNPGVILNKVVPCSTSMESNDVSKNTCPQHFTLLVHSLSVGLDYHSLLHSYQRGLSVVQDPEVHLKHLKPSPPANPLVDRCIECGFCESNCPSRDITLTPRQRITVWREINRLRAMPSRGAAEEARLADLVAGYDYQGESTCAADGMCQVKCPVKINTGELIKEIRADNLDGPGRASSVAARLANHFGTINAVVPPFLNLIDLTHRVVGPKPLEAISSGLNRLSGNMVPQWNPYMPKGASKLNMKPEEPQQTATGIPREVLLLSLDVIDTVTGLSYTSSLTG